MIAAMWLMTTCFRVVPLSVCWRLGEGLGILLFYILPSKRKIVRFNLEIISKKYPEIKVSTQSIRAIFKRSFANLTCAIKTYGMEPEEVLKHVDTAIPDELIEEAQKGLGSIQCLAHMGNWEILSKIFTPFIPKGSKFGAIFRPLDNEIVNKYVLEQRKKFGCELFPKRTSIMRLSAFVKDSGHLGILADQRAGKNKRYARPFFGQSSARSKLPALLQRRTRAKLYMIACYSVEKARWKIEISPIQVDSEDTEEILSAITQAYENAFRAHPMDVFWLHEYWKLSRNRD